VSSCRIANKLINKSRQDYYQNRLLECDKLSAAKRWQTVNELLHAHQTDKTRTDAENRDLVNSFSTFFVSKISGLKSAVSNKLASISNPVFFQDSFHTGHLLHICQPVTTAEVLRILHSVPPKSSSVDFVPPSLVKSCVFAELIAELANRSFSNGCFSACFKHAAITPLLKKPTLETSDPSSYRPISSLDFISEILERLFLAHFQPHVLVCSNFNHHQSAYRPRHSTETSLLSTLDTIYRASDIGSSTLLVSLDLSAAFDTIDHVTLINRLRTSFGITGSVLSWLQSYLSNRTQSVRIGHHSSTPTKCTTGVPKGSVLGPLLFATYTSPSATITRSFQVCPRDSG